MIDPAGFNPLDIYFASLNGAIDDTTPSEIRQPTNKPDPSAWLDEQKRFFRLDNDAALENFTLQFFRSDVPDIEALAESIHTRFETIVPSRKPILTNPNSEPFTIVQTKVKDIVSSLPDMEVFYTTPHQRLSQSKTVAILIGDEHISEQIATANFNCLRSLYESKELKLSSSFNEGRGNAESILSSMPQDLSSTKIHSQVQTGHIVPEQGLLYLMRNDRTAQTKFPNAPYLSYNPETLTEALEMDANLRLLIPIACGLASCTPNQNPDVYNNATLCMQRILYTKHGYEKNGLTHEFYALLGSRLKKTLDTLDYPEQIQRRIMQQSLAAIKSYSNARVQGTPQSWKQFLPQIPRIINSRQMNTLGNYISQAGHQHTIIYRNNAIADLFSKAEPGTRTMKIGIAHIDEQESGSYNLITLLENRGVPVIVLKPRSLTV